jgi:dynein heavy chain 1
MDPINDIPFSAYVSKKVKEQLEQATIKMKEIPNGPRGRPPFEDYKKIIEDYKKMNITMGELKSEAMKPRHWKDLLHKLKISCSFNELTLNHLWIADLIKNDKHVKDILNQARGELILEEFLRNIKECWSKYELELIKY